MNFRIKPIKKTEEKLNNILIWRVLIILSVLLIFSKVFFSRGIILFGDIPFPFDLKLYISQFYPLWSENLSFPTFQNVIYLPFVIPILFTSIFLGLSTAFYEKFLYFAFFSLAGLFMFHLINFLLKKNENVSKKSRTITAFLIALVYVVNPWTLVRMAHVHILLGYSTMPLFLFFVFKILESKKYPLFYIILTSLLWAFFSGIHFGYLFMLVLFGTSGLYLFLERLKLKLVLQIFLRLVNILALYLILAAYWIVPYIFSSWSQSVKPLYLNNLEFLDTVSRFAQITNVFRLISHWWPYLNWPFPDYQLFPAYLIILSFSFVALIFIAPLLFPKNKYVIFSLVFSLLLIFLGTGTQIFPKFYQWIVFKPYGWLFRDPHKWLGALVLFYCILLAFSLAGLSQLGEAIKNKFLRKVVSITPLVIFFLTYSLFAYPLTKEYFNKTFNSISPPKAFLETNKWLKDQEDFFKVIWLPVYGTRPTPGKAGSIPIWNKDHLAGSTDIYSSSKPTLAPFTPMASRFYNFLYDYLLLGNRTSQIDKVISFLGSKYLIYHSDIEGLEKEHQEALQSLEKQKNLTLAFKKDFISVFKNSSYSSLFNILNPNILVEGGLNVFSSLSEIHNFSPLTHSVNFLQQEIGLGKKFLDFNNPEGILVLNSLEGLALSFVKEDEIISPFLWTNHYNPGNIWSKTDVNQTDWNSFLKKANFLNWDFDYNKGLVFTSAARTLKDPKEIKITPSSLVKKYDFENKAIENFYSLHPDNLRLSADNKLSQGKFSLQAQLKKNDPLGLWKIASTNFIEVKENAGYHYSAMLAGENAVNVHLKVIYYSTSEKVIGADFLKGEHQSGNFGFEKNEGNFIAPPKTNKIKIQVWAMENSEKESAWRLDDLLMYDLSKYTSLNELKMSKEIGEKGDYDFYIRYFKNQEGGSISVFLDDNEISLDTKSENNQFVWQKLGVFQMDQGKHQIILRNNQGFNAINILTMVKKENMENYLNSAKTLVDRYKNLYIIDPELLQKQKDSKANGKLPLEKELLVNFDVAKGGKYRLAFQLLNTPQKSDVLVEFGDQQKILSPSQGMEGLEWYYLDSINLTPQNYFLKLIPQITSIISLPESPKEIKDNWESLHPQKVQLSIDTAKTLKPALKGTVNQGTDDKIWKVCSTLPIDANEDKEYKVSLELATQSANKIHAKIQYYDNQDKAFDADFIGADFNGDVDFQQRELKFTTPHGTAKFRIQIWAMENPILESHWWIRKIFLAPLENFPLVNNIALFEASKNEDLENIFKVQNPLEIKTKFETINQTKYKIKVDGATKPFILTFANIYDPLWTAKIDGKIIRPIPLYSLSSGFLIDKKGDFEIEIEYQPQKLFIYGVLTTLAGLVFCFISLLFIKKRK